jgi:hypothetical protein
MLVRTKDGPAKTVHDRLVIKVASTDMRMLVRLQELTGGGRLVPLPLRSERHQQAWEWILPTLGVRELLTAIRPHLVVKGEQADVALEFTPIVRGAGRGKRISPEEDVRRDGIKRRLTVLKGRMAV